jgi:glycosyltransferase involved in cell wall biosynthesis
MRPAIVIPFFNHGGAIGTVLASIAPLNLPCIIVDDGSDAAAKQALTAAITQHRDITLVSLPQNGGKGAAVMAGCDAALAAGFTHAVQIDADGQHQASDIPRLLEAAHQQPQALITGQPMYDESVPRGRHYGRYVTHVWVWINTLSLQIKDSMCGLRVYPLASACAVWQRARLGQRMDFDPEIMVRMHWAGVQVVSIPVQVTYPADGVSHFKMLRDNVLISGMHARLFCGMLLRLPLLLTRRIRNAFLRVSPQ